jgi:TorA maturation chaperone TorD
MTRALENRLCLYSYAWGLFSAEPSAELLRLAASELPGDEAALLSGVGSRLVGIQADLQRAALRIQGSTEALRSDYVKLFVGPTRLPAPPWESVYLTEGDLIFQESTLEVRAAYREAGYQAAGYPHEADDHLATELNFMMSLIEDTKLAYGNEDALLVRALLTAQGKFLEEHLNKWLLPFADRLNEKSPRGTEEFYPLAAYFVAELCARDAEALKELSSAV